VNLGHYILDGITKLGITVPGQLRRNAFNDRSPYLANSPIT